MDNQATLAGQLKFLRDLGNPSPLRKRFDVLRYMSEGHFKTAENLSG